MKLVLFGLVAVAINAQANCDHMPPSQLWQLIKTKHPQLAKAQARVSISESVLTSSRQRPNPELNLSADAGESLEGDVRTIEAGVLIPIELGDKRSARIEAAHKHIELAKKERELVEADILIRSYVLIHRLRQITHLAQLQNDAIASMKRYRDNLNKRSSLSPEQEVELGAIELALSDMELKLVGSINQQQEIARHLGFYAGLDCAIAVSSLPTETVFAPLEDQNEVTDGELALARLRVEEAQAALSLAKANAARNISIGPIIRYEKENYDEIYAVGVAINFELPFFDRNQGERFKALKTVAAREIELNNVRKESHFDLETWQRRYKRSVESLKNAGQRSLLKQKREKVETFFARGVISAALVIETYRQLIEFTQSRNDFELEALEAQAQILKLTGKIDQLQL